MKCREGWMEMWSFCGFRSLSFKITGSTVGWMYRQGDKCRCPFCDLDLARHDINDGGQTYRPGSTSLPISPVSMIVGSV